MAGDVSSSDGGRAAVIPDLHASLARDTFLSYYYLKSELVSFCRQEGLQTVGSKANLTARIAHFMASGERVTSALPRRVAATVEQISAQSLTEDGFVCSQRHRMFFRQAIGPSFTSNVAFHGTGGRGTGGRFSCPMGQGDGSPVPKKQVVVLVVFESVRGLAWLILKEPMITHAPGSFQEH